MDNQPLTSPAGDAGMSRFEGSASDGWRPSAERLRTPRRLQDRCLHVQQPCPRQRARQHRRLADSRPVDPVRARLHLRAPGQRRRHRRRPAVQFRRSISVLSRSSTSSWNAEATVAPPTPTTQPVRSPIAGHAVVFGQLDRPANRTSHNASPARDDFRVMMRGRSSRPAATSTRPWTAALSACPPSAPPC